MNASKLLFRPLTFLIMLIAAAASLLPIYWLVISAVKPADDIFVQHPSFFPSHFSWESVKGLFSETKFGRAILNSVVIAALYTLLSCFISSLSGFALAKFHSAAKKYVFGFIILSLLIPQAVLIVPLFILVSKLHMANTYWGVILPMAASPFGVFWMKQYIANIPNDLIEAARIDGTSDWGIYRRIILPTITPGLAALGIFLFMQQWNDFLWPLIVLRTEEMYTIPISLSLLKGAYSMQWGQLMAGASIATLPFVILFLFLQRYFIAGVLGGSVKE